MWKQQDVLPTEAFSLEADPGFQSGVFHHCFWERKRHWNCSNFLIAYVDYIKESVYFQTVTIIREFSHLNIFSACSNYENNCYAKEKNVPKGIKKNFYFGGWMQSIVLGKIKLVKVSAPNASKHPSE